MTQGPTPHRRQNHRGTPTIQTRLMVGLEIHVELATRSKMFSRAPNVAHPDYYEAPPNTLCDPVVLGMPGVLPVINKQAVEMSMLVGLALGCRIARQTKWDRKSYYYPDLPKNYQISQYDQPLCYDGQIDVPGDDAGDPPKRIRIIRAHLEEDAGKLLHEAPGGAKIDHSIVDLNRAGTPLLEIVTQPDLETAEQVVVFAQSLRDICRHLGVSQCIMQRGHMRFEPNINVVIASDGQTYKTPIVEVKNLNSFRALHGAVTYEYERQVDRWLETRQTAQPGSKSTRGWDDDRGVTFAQREKEEAHDYRYFPDPDLVPLVIDDAWVDEVRARLTELPLDRHRRYTQSLGLGDAETRTIIEDPTLCGFFDGVVAIGGDPQKTASMLLNYGAKRANEQGLPIAQLGITPHQVAGIAQLVAADRIGSSAADRLFGYCCQSDEEAESLAQKHGLMQVSDSGALETFVDQVLTDPGNAKIVADIRAGKDKAIGALVGQVMKMSKGQANAKLVGQIIRTRATATEA